MATKRPRTAKPKPDTRLYTYQAGQKVYLDKAPDQFVVRAKPEQLPELGFEALEQVSPSSFRVSVPRKELDESMERAREVATTHHAYVHADSGAEFLITDRIFVRFKEGVTPDQIGAFAGRYGLFPRETYTPRDYLYQLTTHTAMNPVKLIVTLNENEKDVIEFAEHDLNRQMDISALSLPTDPSYLNEWHLHRRLFDPEFDARSSSRAEEAWQLLGHFGTADMVIGITDDGCQIDHPDFAAPGKIASWGYFQGTTLFTKNSPGADPANMYQLEANHGTSCAGVAAGDANGALTVGAAPSARILPIKWESQARRLLISDSKLLTALNFIADKVDILSNSWSGAPFALWPIPVIQRIAELAKTGGRRGKGILFLWAAGNANCPLKHSGDIAIPYDHGWAFDSVGTPVWAGVKSSKNFDCNLVGIDGVLHVAAIASTAARSHYSCYGTGISISGPTSNSHLYQRLPVSGLGIIAATGLASHVRSDFGGTSSATPLLAGIAALVLSANPDLTALQLASLLKQTASKDLSLSGYPKTPPSTFDPNPSWDVSPIPPHDSGAFIDIGSPDGSWSPWFGHGKADAAAAVQKALDARQVSTAPVMFDSSPDLIIPDDQIEGVRHRMNVTSQGVLRDVEVSVHIAHTWIGDLRITLISPQGTAVVLHDRAGSNTQNINASWTINAVPALADFRDTSIQGTWTLWIQDMALRDEGRLISWSLKLNVSAVPVNFQDEAVIDIPPAGDSVRRQLILPSGRLVRELTITLDLSHPDVSQLQIEIEPPNRPRLFLAEPGMLAGDSLQRTWKSPDLAALAELHGKDPAGAWALRIAAQNIAAAGKLNRWSIGLLAQ